MSGGKVAFLSKRDKLGGDHNLVTAVGMRKAESVKKSFGSLVTVIRPLSEGLCPWRSASVK
jgi:hypothetical protein